jgi:hypothetical protein
MKETSPVLVGREAGDGVDAGGGASGRIGGGGACCCLASVEVRLGWGRGRGSWN